MMLASVTVVAFVHFGVVVRTTVGVAVVIAVVRIVCVNGIVDGDQQHCACVHVGFIIAVFFSTSFVVSVLSVIATVVGGVSGTVCLVIDFSRVERVHRECS